MSNSTGRSPQGRIQTHPPRDFIPLAEDRSRFEKEALEVTLEGRLALMAAYAARIREVCSGLQGHPRVRDMSYDDKADLRDAVDDASDLAVSLSNFMGVLLDQEPTRSGRERSLKAEQRGGRR